MPTPTIFSEHPKGFLQAHDCCVCPQFYLVPDSRFAWAQQEHFGCNISPTNEWDMDWNLLPEKTNAGQYKSTGHYESYSQGSTLNPETETRYVSSKDWVVEKYQEAWSYSHTETWPNLSTSLTTEGLAPTYSGRGFYSSKLSYKAYNSLINEDGIVTWERTETQNVSISGDYSTGSEGAYNLNGDREQTGTQVITITTRTLIDGEWVADTVTETTPMDSTTAGGLDVGDTFDVGDTSPAVTAYRSASSDGDAETLPELPSGDFGDWAGSDVPSLDDSTGPPPEDIPAPDAEGNISYVNDPPPVVAYSYSTTLGGSPATPSELRGAAEAAMAAQSWPSTPEESGIGAAIALREEDYHPDSQEQLDTYGGSFVLSSVTLRDGRYKIRHAIPTYTKNYRVTGEIAFHPGPGIPGEPIPPEPEPGTGTPVDAYVWDKTVPTGYDKTDANTYPVSPSFTYIPVPDLPGYNAPSLTASCRPPPPP